MQFQKVNNPMHIFLVVREVRVKLVLQRFLPKLLIVLIVTMVNLVMNVRFVKESHKVRITM